MLAAVRFLAFGVAAVIASLTLLVSLDSSPPRAALSQLVEGVNATAGGLLDANATSDELLDMIAPPTPSPTDNTLEGTASDAYKLQQKIYRENKQYEEEEAGRLTNGASTSRQPPGDGTFEAELESKSKLVARERLALLLGNDALSSLVAGRDLPGAVVPPLITYLLRRVEDPAAAKDDTVEKKLADAYTPTLQAAAATANKSAPFVSLRTELGAKSRLLWHSAAGQGSALSNVSSLLADRYELGFMNISRRANGEHGGRLEESLIQAHTALSVTDAVAANIMKDASTIMSAWKVIARAKAPTVLFEHAGSEGVCMESSASGLGPEQYLCLLYMDAKDAMPRSRREPTWFASPPPCRGAADYFVSSRRLYRNFIPPTSLTTCNASADGSNFGALSISAELMSGASIAAQKKMKEKKWAAKQWLENLELRNVCLSPDGTFFANFTPGRVHGQQFVLQTEGRDLLLYPIKREHNRRSERLRIRPLPVKNNTTELNDVRCRVRKTAFLIPLMEPMMNVAHMFFRTASNMLSAGYSMFLRTPPSERLVVFHSALGGDGLMPGNNYRISYEMLNSAWLGIQPTFVGRPPAGRRPDEQLMCFDRLVVLWRTVLMYRSKNKFAAGPINQLPWKYTIPALKGIRGAFIKCLVGQEASASDERRYKQGSPVVVTVVQRRLRRRALLNLGELLQAFAVDLAVGRIGGVEVPDVALRIVDMEALTPNQQAAIIHESDIVVGPHGAGMAWALLMRPRTVFAEFRDTYHYTPDMFAEGIDIPAFVGSEYGKLVYAAGAHYVHKRIFDRVLCYPFEGLSIHQCDYNVTRGEFVQHMRVALDVFLKQVDTFKA